eukprot:jgi/Tetstr1/464904/TSEL_009638.t1
MFGPGGRLHGLGSAARRGWTRYETALQSKPVSTQAVTTALLWGVGDLASQRVERKKNFDWRRTMQTMAYAGCCLGPIGHFWYLGLDTVAARYLQPGTLANAMNFWRVPVEHQLLAVNIACIFDSTFLCWAKHEDQWAASLMEKIKGRGSQSDRDGK